MSTMYSYSVEMTSERCYTCGRYWKRELYFDGLCPYCAYKNRGERNARIEELERSNAALRGTITRLKNRSVA